MKTCISRARLATLPLALAAAFPSFPSVAEAQDAPQLKAVVISATRSPTRADELVSDVVVIERAEIEKAVGRTLREILARVPVVEFSANGGLGEVSSSNIRGTVYRH